LAADLHNHWTDSPEWYADRRLWAFYFTFSGQTALHARVLRDQEALQGVPGLDPIARQNLHLSLQGTAFTDQVELESVEELASTVQGIIQRMSLPELWAYRTIDDVDAMVMPIFPVQEMDEIKNLVQGAALEILGPDKVYQLPESPGGFSPHISIAYANSFIPGATVAHALRLVNDEVTSFRVQHLSLVALRREATQRSWTWDQERRLSFDDAGQAVMQSTP
jgi:hypothetical protein